MLRTFAALIALILPVLAAAVDRDTASARKVEFVQTGLFLIHESGYNTVVRLTGNGIILVDGSSPGHYRDLVSAAQGIADELPIRLLVTTNTEPVHSGTNREFLNAGVPVMAQTNAREHLLATSSTAENVAPPSLTFETEHTLKLGGVTVQLFYFGPAHTDADTVVYFPDLKVVAVGDLFTREMPDARIGAGGSLVGWDTVLDKILTLDFEKMVPGQGPVGNKSDVRELKSRIDRLLSRPSTAIEETRRIP
jgi:glyoxylase-like metal-dependent hydrolase (beta-lactamase superfamily II)